MSAFLTLVCGDLPDESNSRCEVSTTVCAMSDSFAERFDFRKATQFSVCKLSAIS